MATHVRWLQDLDPDTPEETGTEAAVLGLLLQEGFAVLPGFLVTAHACEILSQTAQGAAPPDPSLERELREACSALASEGERATVRLSVRRLVAERDSLPDTAPGFRETVVEVLETVPVVETFGRALASLLMEEGSGWPNGPGGAAFSAGVALLVQRFFCPEVSGVLVPVAGGAGGRRELVIDACWGLVHAATGRELDTDRFVMQRDPPLLLEQSVGSKERMLVGPGSGGGLPVEKDVPEHKAEMPCLGWDQIEEIAETSRAMERVVGAAESLLWAFAADELYILQYLVPRGTASRKVTSVTEEDQRTGKPVESIPDRALPEEADGEVGTGEAFQPTPPPLEGPPDPAETDAGNDANRNPSLGRGVGARAVSLLLRQARRLPLRRK